MGADDGNVHLMSLRQMLSIAQDCVEQRRPGTEFCKRSRTYIEMNQNEIAYSVFGIAVEVICNLMHQAVGDYILLSIDCQMLTSASSRIPCPEEKSRDVISPVLYDDG
jgi:hypothetical protein